MVGYCVHVREVSQSVATELGRESLIPRIVGGGFEAWREGRLPIGQKRLLTNVPTTMRAS